MTFCAGLTKSGLYRPDGAAVPGAPCRAHARKGSTFCAAHDPAPPDYEAMLVDADRRLRRCLEAYRRGEWEPTATERALMHFVARAMREAIND